MTDRARELLEAYDVDPELIEALLWRYGADLDVPDPEALDDVHEQVYEFLADDGSLRSALDHYYRFENHPEYGIHSDALATEPDFEIVLDDLVAEGLIARTADELPRYSASFHDLLQEVGPRLTAAAVDRLCAESGTNKRAVYYHILDSPDLDLDLGRDADAEGRFD